MQIHERYQYVIGLTQWEVNWFTWLFERLDSKDFSHLFDRRDVDQIEEYKDLFSEYQE